MGQAARKADSREDRVAGRYLIQRRLGRGGMGEVYRAVDESTGQVVALKRVLKLDRESHRLRLEFQTLAGLRHPRIVDVHDFGHDGELPYYTMELLDGHDLRDVGDVTLKQACLWLRDVASALACLHARGLVHRDVAPRNVRCTSDGRAKLIDFGVLATSGVWGEIVGTPSAMAPEMLLGEPIDHRADLFSLGALGYRLLTGRNAYQGRQVADLLFAHQKAPAPPSSLVPEIPKEFDELILSLLSQRPLARPKHAAEVIDRLNAIAQLEPDPELDVAQGYIQSAGIVGRDRELGAARRRIERALGGEGKAIIIRGDLGTGKTRLLREIAVEAQLSGLTVVRAEGESGRRKPYGVVQHLAAELLKVAPEVAVNSVGTNADELTAIIPGLSRHLGTRTAMRIETNLRADLRENRLETQNAVRDWLFRCAEAAPLALVVDDLNWCDEASASVLTALALEVEKHALLVVGSLRRGERIRAPDTIDKLARSARRIRCKPLTVEQVGDLVKEMFGDTPNGSRLADWLHRATEGNVAECVEHAHRLVVREIVSYGDGMWIVPEELGDPEACRDSAALIRSQLEELSPGARTLLNVLCVYREAASFGTCISVSELDDEQALSALDELTRAELVTASGGSYRLRRSAVADVLRDDLSDELEQSLELRVGNLLVEAGVTFENEARVGAHLVRGGDLLSGAKLLEQAGRRLYGATSFGEAIGPLETALAVYESEKVSPRLCLELKFMLLAAGFYSDRHVAKRHRDALLGSLAGHSGIALSRRLARYFGSTLGVYLAFAVTAVRWVMTPGARRGPSLIDALRMYIRGVSYSAAIAAFELDQPALGAMSDKLRPLRRLNRLDTRATVTLTSNLYNYNRGRVATVFRKTDEVLGTLAKAAGFSEDERRSVEGGLRFQRGLVLTRKADDALLHEIEKIEALDTRVWNVSAAQLRTQYHLWRGEEALAQSVWAQAELDLVRLGAAWQVESAFHASSAQIYSWIWDSVGLKRTLSALARVAKDRPGYTSYLDLGRAEYHQMRGDYRRARDAVERARKGTPAEHITSDWSRLLDAEICLHEGKLLRAEELARDGLKDALPREACRLAVVYGMVSALRGDHSEAAERMEAQEKAMNEAQNPIFRGRFYEGWGRIALMAEDQLALQSALAEVNSAFLPTKNAALVARAERLSRAAASSDSASESHDSLDSLETVVAAVHSPSSQSISLLSECSTLEECTRRALELIIGATGASGGQLYLLSDDGLELVASQALEEPNGELKAALDRLLAFTLRDNDKTMVGEQTATATTFGPTSTLQTGTRWRALVFAVPGEGRLIPVSAAALIEGSKALVDPDPRLTEAVARNLDRMTA